jgi:hypothetical protein
MVGDCPIKQSRDRWGAWRGSGNGGKGQGRLKVEDWLGWHGKGRFELVGEEKKGDMGCQGDESDISRGHGNRKQCGHYSQVDKWNVMVVRLWGHFLGGNSMTNKDAKGSIGEWSGIGEQVQMGRGVGLCEHWLALFQVVGWTE